MLIYIYLLGINYLTTSKHILKNKLFTNLTDKYLKDKILVKLVKSKSRY